MHQVGVLTALEERLNDAVPGFDIYVGCSAGSVVASLLANGIEASEIYRVLDHDLPSSDSCARRITRAASPTPSPSSRARC
jgi:NTE family protein